MEKSEKALWKTLDNAIDNDKKFLKQLSKWVIKHYGNVNVSQRLNIIAISC